jgi:hypothetical protein
MKKPDNHYVSKEAPQHQPVCVDEQHASIEEGHPDPLTETQDGAGVLAGHSQQADQAPEDLGGEAERDVKKTKVAERHVTSEAGEVVRSRRHKALVSAKREGEKVFKRGTKK